MPRKPLLASALALLVTLPALAEDTLRFSVSNSWNMPFARFDNERLTGGIMYDLGMALERPLGRSITFVVLPRKRIDAASLAGDIDLRCYINPKWTDIPDQFVWSGRMFDLPNVVFGMDRTEPVKDLAEVKRGSAISTVLGYSYPTLEPLLTDGQLLREDTIDQEKVMLKVSAGRTPYGVADLLALNWYQRTTPLHRHAAWRLVVSREDIQCAIPKKGQVPADKILVALDGLRKSGKIEEILRNYR